MSRERNAEVITLTPELTRAMTLEINQAINASAERLGPGVSGATVAEALLLCIVGRMKQARDIGQAAGTWSERRALMIQLFDMVAEEIGATD